MSNKTDYTKQTFTHQQVEDLMWYAMRNYERNLNNQMKDLETDKVFQAEAAKENYTPLNWLYYAQHDISQTKGVAIGDAWEEYENIKKTKSAADAVIGALSIERLSELLTKDFLKNVK